MNNPSAAEALKTEEPGDTALALVDIVLPGKTGIVLYISNQNKEMEIIIKNLGIKSGIWRR